MAEIDIQKKQGSMWPWIVGLLALVLVIWVAVEAFDDDDNDMALTDPTEEQAYPTDAASAAPAASTMPAAVMSFEEQCASADGMTGEMARDHEFATTCVRHLTAALEAVIQRDTVGGTALATELEQFRTTARRLTTNPDSPEHSAVLSDVMKGAASLIDEVEETRMNGSAALERRAGRVMEAAESFDANGVLLDQRDAVASFFREASSALRALATQEVR